MTPEGKVKAAVNRLLKPYIERYEVYKFMPVQTGYGMKTLDYLLCAWGKFLAIETKAPGKEPTELQETYIREIEAAGGKVFVVDGGDSLLVLSAYLQAKKMEHASTSQPETQDAGGAVTCRGNKPIPRGKTDDFQRSAIRGAAPRAH